MLRTHGGEVTSGSNRAGAEDGESVERMPGLGEETAA